MRGNNRKSIEKCRKKLPQFTTMNVIDGQAGLVIYSSLIFYSLTIDNILNIIILIILAGISISMLTGQNGILNRAAEAKEKTEKAQAEEQSALSELESQMNNYQDDGFDKEKGVNRPQLASGMTRVMFTDPTSSSNGTIIKDGESGWSTDWYDYNSQKWANVMTKDGSMWVWIPRYAYITVSYTHLTLPTNSLV